MASPIHNTFIRRPKGHRITESTCERCFLTVAAAKRENELRQAEQNHVCDPWLMEQWRQMFEYSPSGRTTEKSQP